jgi:hypothetical protein
MKISGFSYIRNGFLYNYLTKDWLTKKKCQLIGVRLVKLV